MSSSPFAGIGLTVLAGVALVALLAGSHPSDLTVAVRSSRPYSSVISIWDAEQPTILQQGLRPKHEPLGFLGSGLTLTTWQVNYGPAYHREVTWPVLIGPFHGRDDFICGYTLNLGAALFDPDGAARGVAAAIERALRSQLTGDFQESVDSCDINVTYPEIRSVVTRMQMDEGFVTVGIAVLFADESRFSVSADLVIDERNGALGLGLRPDMEPKVELLGPFRRAIVEQAAGCGASAGALLAGAAGLVLFGPAGLWGALAGADIGADMGTAKAEQAIPEAAQRKVTSEVRQALDNISRGMAGMTQPIALSKFRPEDSLQVRLASEPIVSKAGVKLPICILLKVPGAAHVGEDRGPVNIPELPTLQVESPSDSLAVSLDANAINQLTHYLWDTGLLRDLGKSPPVFDALAQRLKVAAFSFTGVDPMLPPTVTSSNTTPTSIGVGLGAVRLGTLGDRIVFGHAKFGLDVAHQLDTFSLVGKVQSLHVNCLATRKNGQVLTPCLGDLLPIALKMSRKANLTYSFKGEDVLATLPRLEFEGMHVDLSRLQVSTTGSPPSLALSARAEVK